MQLFARPLRMLVPALVLALSACSDDGGGGEDDESSDSGSSLEPSSGTWLFSGGPVVDDTCMFDDLYVDPPGTFTLASNGDGTFTIDDGSNVFDCTLSGSSYECPSRLTSTVDVGMTYMLPVEAVVSYNVAVSGEFSDADTMSGRQDFELTCEGADCEGLADLLMLTVPCGYAQEFTATAS